MNAPAVSWVDRTGHVQARAFVAAPDAIAPTERLKPSLQIGSHARNGLIRLEMAPSVDPGQEAEALLAVGAIGNIGPDIPVPRCLADGGAVIPLVAEQRGAFGNGLDQRFSSPAS